MTRPGPTPAPTALKIVRGTRRDRVNLREPRAPMADRVPAPPKHLSPPARAVWRKHAADLHGAGLLTLRGVEAFEVYCEAVVAHRAAAKNVAERGILVSGDRGLVKNQALQIMRDQAQTIRAFAQEFGLTPSAQSTITLPEGADETEARRLLS